MNIYDFIIKDAKGGYVELEQYRGKVLLLVNLASKCGFTPQYEGLEALNKKYADKGLVILGFPCNQFKEQEPGSEQEILDFCSATYGVDFPIMKKTDVNGPSESPLFYYLKNVAQPQEVVDVPKDHPYYGFFQEFHGGDWGKEIVWNFHKFLIGKDGTVVGRYASPTTPEELGVKIEALL